MWTVNWTDFSITGSCRIRRPNWLAGLSLLQHLLLDWLGAHANSLGKSNGSCVLLLLVLLLCMTPTAGTVSLEFSLAAIFSSGPGDLRGGSLASQAGVTDPGYSRAWTCRLDRRRGVDLPHGWRIRFAAHLDSYWTGCGLVVFRAPAARFRISLLGARRDHILRVARHVSLHSDELRSSALQFFSRTA